MLRCVIREKSPMLRTVRMTASLHSPVTGQSNGRPPPASARDGRLDSPAAGAIRAGNACDGDALIATFAEAGMANDIQREFWGVKPIREWTDREIIRDGKIVRLIIIHNKAADWGRR